MAHVAPWNGATTQMLATSKAVEEPARLLEIVIGNQRESDRKEMNKGLLEYHVRKVWVATMSFR